VNGLGWLREYSKPALRSALRVAGAGPHRLPIELTGTNDLSRPTWASGIHPVSARSGTLGLVVGCLFSDDAGSNQRAVKSSLLLAAPLLRRGGGAVVSLARLRSELALQRGFQEPHAEPVAGACQECEWSDEYRNRPAPQFALAATEACPDDSHRRRARR
jgi:hypothetical protein